MNDDTDLKIEYRPRLRLGWRGRFMIVCLSLVFALMGAELAAGFVRGWAFPYLNLYRADARYGVVLRPDSKTILRSREGRLATIRTNEEGFRGPDWGAKDLRQSRILLLGDSQVFGYGVNYADSLGAQLEYSLGPETRVMNAAVPTWGPPEYVQVMRDLVPEYKPDVVIFVVNVANDWLEASVPNLKRTTEQDGWTTRKSRSLAPITWYPGRSYIHNRSQLFFLMRSLREHVRPRRPSARPRAHLADALLRNLEQWSKPHGEFKSKITPHLANAQKLCRQHGCELITLTLPLDVQVSESEWKKYNSEPRDLSAAGQLSTNYLSDTKLLGVTGFDLLPILSAASPGAFLPDDYHMSAKGYTAIAEHLSPIIKRTSTSKPPRKEIHHDR